MEQMCNLFENSNSSEWLLYISEWTAPHTTSPLSNIRVTTKVAVTALLSDRPLLQERGSAVIYNLAIKEVKTVVGIQFQFFHNSQQAKQTSRPFAMSLPRF